MTHESPPPLLIKIKGDRFWAYPNDPFVLTRHEEELMALIEEHMGLPGLLPDDPDGLYYFNTWVLDEENEVVNTIRVPDGALKGAEEHIRMVNSWLGEDPVESPLYRDKPTGEDWMSFETGLALGMITFLIVVKHKDFFIKPKQ